MEVDFEAFIWLDHLFELMLSFVDFVKRFVELFAGLALYKSEILLLFLIIIRVLLCVGGLGITGILGCHNDETTPIVLSRVSVRL